MRPRLVPAMLLLLCAGTCSRAHDASLSLEPLVFSFVASPASDSGQWIEAMAAPNGETVATSFRLWLGRPGLASKKPEVIPGIMRRGDPQGAQWLLVMLGAAFFPLPSKPESSGGLMPIDLSGAHADSLPLQLAVHSTSTRPTWLAEARLPNGARFSITLDETTKRGELRAVDRRGDMRVFTSLAGLLVGPR
jgi:hypothetical protein